MPLAFYYLEMVPLHGLRLQAGLADSLQFQLIGTPRLLFRCVLTLFAVTAVSPAPGLSI
jgi:hypothetical protein